MAKICEHIKQNKARLVFDDTGKATLCPICKRIVNIKDVPAEFRTRRYKEGSVYYLPPFIR